MDQSTLTEIFETIPVLLFAFVAHEWGHAFAALKQGDSTAYDAGRLTFNPIVHIDPLRTIIVPLLLLVSGNLAVGGAKACPVNPANFRNYKRGDIIVSLAGVTMNILVAIASTILFFAFGLLGRVLPGADAVLGIVQELLMISVTYNLLLTFINLLPIPGFDGAHVLAHFLSPSAAASYRAMGAYSLLFLFAFVSFAGGVFDMLISPVFLLRDVMVHPVLPYALSLR